MARTRIMALHSCRMKMVYQAMAPPMSNSFGGYLLWSSATWAEVKPRSRSVLTSSTTSSIVNRKGCFLVSAAMTRGSEELARGWLDGRRAQGEPIHGEMTDVGLLWILPTRIWVWNANCENPESRLRDVGEGLPDVFVYRMDRRRSTAPAQRMTGAGCF